MSAIIYTKGNDDDFSFEQLELLHKFSDQARVWAFLLLKEAGLIRSPEEWHEKRQQLRDLENELKQLDAKYADAVIAAVRKPYQESAADPSKTYEASKDAMDATLPTYADLAKDKTPDAANKAQGLASKIQALLADLYPAKSKVSFRGPFLSQDESNAIFTNPETKEELDKYLKDVGPDPFKYKGEYGDIRDLLIGFAYKNHVVDPESGARADPTHAEETKAIAEDFAMDVLARALQLYNPHKSEDTGAGYEGQKASFGTYLYRAMINERNARTKAFEGGKNVPVPLSLPGGEDADLTLEEMIAEKAKKEDRFNFSSYLAPFQSWLEQYMSRPGSKYSPESAERLLNIYKRIFIDGHRITDVAREMGFVTDRPRDKEISTMKKLGIDVSPLPQTIPPGVSLALDRDMRAKMWTSFFKAILDKIKALEQQPQSPETSQTLEKLRAKHKEAMDALMQLSRPNTARIHNLVWGGPAQQGQQGPNIMQFLKQYPEFEELLQETSKLKKRQSLEDFLILIPKLRKEGGLNYDLLRHKIQQKLSEDTEQLFRVYTYLYESDYSNPDTAKLMSLSPSRITGLKKKIVSTLLELPEIQNILTESENGSTSPLRRFIYKEGDVVKVLSINETGTITGSYKNNWYEVTLDNGNEVVTIKDDIEKHCTLIDSANNVLSHYFKRSVLTPQCYLSFVSGIVPRLVILELRPSSEIKTTARLHVNNNLIDITEITEQYPDNLMSILKGHLGTDAALDTPFTSLFEEVDGQ